MTADNNGWFEPKKPIVLMNVHRIGDRIYVLAEEAHAAVTEARKQERTSIAAREAAAWIAGRDAVADYVDECLAALGAPFGTASVRALTPPADFAAALEAVRREEREACAAIAEAFASGSHPAWREPVELDNGDIDRAGAGNMLDRLPAAIRARGEEGGR